MYRLIARRYVRRLFGRLDVGDIDALLDRCDDDVMHSFAGAHALGGTRVGTSAVRSWFARLQRLFPELRFDVEQVAVDGPPWNTTAVIRWRDHGTRADGQAYDNRGVHVVTIRWGRAMSIDAHLDTARLDAALAEMDEHGIAEARAQPLTGAGPHRDLTSARNVAGVRS